MTIEEHIQKFVKWHFEPNDLKLVIGIQKGAHAVVLTRTKDYKVFEDTIKKYDGKYNLYTVVNKVDDLNANKPSTETVTNGEIIKYRTLYIDIDPVRKLSKPGVSFAADNEETMKAYNVAEKVYDLLKEYNFPDPLICFTGNGYSLDYALDLPDLSPEQVRKLYVEPIIAILQAKFGQHAVNIEASGVDIDRTVVNESRLRRIPGSLNIKGYVDDEFLKQNSERIHRYSLVDYCPAEKVSVPQDVLQAFIDEFKDLIVARATPSGNRWPTIVTDGMGRHRTLVKLAGYLRGVMGLDEEEIFENLKQYNEKHLRPPKSEKELRHIAKTMMAYDRVNQLHTIADIVIDETYITNCVVAACKDDLRYNIDKGTWMFWNGRYWEIDNTQEIIRRIEQVINDEMLKFTGIASANGIDEFVKVKIIGGKGPDKKQIKNPIIPALKKFLTITNMEKVEKRLRTIEGLYLTSDKLDNDIYLINLKNGVFDLENRQLKPHVQYKDRYLTHLFNAEYDPEAKCPVFDKFLNEIMLGNPEMEKLILQTFGWCLSGDTLYEKFFFFKGSGGNGKSVLGEAMLYIFGDYGDSTSYEAWITNTAKNWEMAQLPGVRYINCSEVPPSCKLNTPLLKKFVSGDTVQAEAKYMRPYNFKPQGKLIFLVNHIPYINDMSNATMRRMVIIPFQFEPAVIDVNLKAKIIAEASGILNRLIEGYYLAKTEQFQILPEPVQKELKEIQYEMDYLAAFIDSECILDKKNKVLNEELDRRYRVWAQINNEDDTRSLRAILKALRDKGFEKYRTADKQYVCGLRLKTDTPAAEKLARMCGATSREL